jgi:hypothetical protein
MPPILHRLPLQMQAPILLSLPTLSTRSIHLQATDPLQFHMLVALTNNTLPPDWKPHGLRTLLDRC